MGLYDHGEWETSKENKEIKKAGREMKGEKDKEKNKSSRPTDPTNGSLAPEKWPQPLSLTHPVSLPFITLIVLYHAMQYVCVCVSTCIYRF